MTRTTLDPKLDVVFKMLFARPANKRLLISLLTAFLEPASPIVDVEVLNPEVTKETVQDKGTVLDILAKLEDGQQVNLEIQTTAQGWSMSRGVFYSSRVFVSQLRKGDGYHELKPVVGIFILDFKTLPAERYHSKFELLEVHDHTRLTDDLTLHVLELPKLPREPPAVNASGVLKWGKFLAAESDEELEQLAMTDPELREGKTALDELSRDPAAQRLAEERRLAAWNFRRAVAEAREQGVERGRQEGLHEAVLHFCKTLGLELTEAQQRQLKASSIDEAELILDHLFLHRQWPDG